MPIQTKLQIILHPLYLILIKWYLGIISKTLLLIPNEGHHGPQADEDRFLDQPFVPQNAIVNKGTNIIWLNGDVG